MPGRPRRWGRGSNQHQKKGRAQQDLQPCEVDKEAAWRRVQDHENILHMTSVSVTRDDEPRAIRAAEYPTSAMSAMTDLPDDVTEVMPVIASSVARDCDMTIPTNAATLGNTAAHDVDALLTREGIPEDRHYVLSMGGMTRMSSTVERSNVETPGVDEDTLVHRTRTDRIDTDHHVVLVTDAHGDNPHIIDPTIAQFAPVSDPNTPVGEQLGSGRSYYGDYPLITPYSEYVANGQFRWDTVHNVQ